MKRENKSVTLLMRSLIKQVGKTHSACLAMLTAASLASPAFAGMPSGCTDLDLFPPQSAVDYGSQIQPIFSACTGCHGDGGLAGLDLRPGEAYGNLVGIASTTNPPQARVQPFEPADSLLLFAINCSETGGPSFQMPGTEPAQRALIRDWIAQGALARPAPRPVPVLHSWGAGVLVVLIVMALLSARVRVLRLRR